MRNAMLAVSAALLVAGCNDPGLVGVPGMRTASAAEVGACAYVMDISAKPGVYGPLAQQGLEYTRNQVLETAREGGANTVVFEQTESGVLVTEVRATAYRC